MTVRTHGRRRFFPCELDDLEGDARMSGTPMIARGDLHGNARGQGRSGRKYEDGGRSFTGMSKKLVPQRGCRR
jgi:hypothetical protein